MAKFITDEMIARMNDSMQWHFKINWDKVETIEDIKVILKEIPMTIQGGTSTYENLKKYI
ncbi:hypothetical protein [Priestia megaterium]|uniref:hypothetical protein n=1 Tax=Priestia megaterium TaxID=1404 RepID=UPI002877A8E7|nr:hypothetical protein [Priestia megaterium]